MLRRLFYIVLAAVLLATLAAPSVNALDSIATESEFVLPETERAAGDIEQTVQAIDEPELPVNMSESEPSAVQLPEPQLPALVTQTTDPVITEPETTPPIIVTTLHVGRALNDIELYNQTDGLIDLSAIRIVVSHGFDRCESRVDATGWLEGRSFVSARSHYAQDANHFTLTNDCERDDFVTRVEIYIGETRVQLIDGISATLPIWLRHKSSVNSCADRPIPNNMKQTGSAANDYALCSMPVAPCDGGGSCLRLHTSEPYKTPLYTDGLRIIEIMSDSRSCNPDDRGADCFDFIKIQNIGDKSVNLAEFRLRTGASTAASTASNTYRWHQPTLHPLRDEYVLDPGQIFTLTKRDNGDPLSITNGSGNVWIEDYHGVQSYHAVSYDGMSLAAARSKSWTFDDRIDQWVFGVPSPFTANQVYVPIVDVGMGAVEGLGLADCGEGRERNPDTNRCRNIPVASILAPCKEWQYRSEETNRCRSIASAAASVLKPCADDQFRNPLTGRCKKIASADELADCGEGRERNPATNRCRNIANSTVPGAGFAVQPIKDSAMTFVGWWALGGVGVLALGYGVWEWRREIAEQARRATRFFVSDK